MPRLLNCWGTLVYKYTTCFAYFVVVWVIVLELAKTVSEGILFLGQPGILLWKNMGLIVDLVDILFSCSHWRFSGIFSVIKGFVHALLVVFLGVSVITVAFFAALEPQNVQGTRAHSLMRRKVAFH